MYGLNQVKKAKINYEKDRPRADNPVKVQDLSFRDGHQSLFATRGRTEDMIPVAEMMDAVGFWAMEVWGGATFDTMHRFLNEDPWERIRILKRYIKNTPFSMLLRGQNLVGYRNYADDVARAFVERASANGIDIFRTFDALNDYRNFGTVVPVIKECNKHFQGCICYSLTEARMGGDVYTIEYYIKKAKDLEAMGADSICIKDMAGLIAPYDAYALVKALKETVKPPIHLHSHFTSGMATRKSNQRNLVKTLYLNPEELNAHNLKLKAKYEQMEREEIRYEVYNLEGEYRLLIVSYGTMSRVCRTAIDNLKQQGLEVGMLRPQHLFPFPQKSILQAAQKSSCEVVLSVEMSMGQMLEDIERSVRGRRQVRWYGKCGGEVPTPEEVMDAISESVELKSAA